MLEFGTLKVVEKTFTREAGGVRGQAYNGLKFRRYNSTKGEKAAKEEGKDFVPFVDEQIVISNKAYETLKLEEYALTQVVMPDGKVLLAVVEDTDEGAVPAKFCRRSKTSDGKLSKKGKMFSNEFLVKDLVTAGIIAGEVLGNQYLSITDVTAEISGIPAGVQALYLVEKDDTVDASKDSEEEDSSVDATKF